MAVTTLDEELPERIIFVQHGWSDTGRRLGNLVRSVAPPGSLVIAPSLNFANTWLRIEPLIQEKTAIAAAALETYPDLPVHIVAHSMGGLIWTEILHRHRAWWPRIESFILIGSPLGGSDVARMIDPLGWGIGIARDLGRSRRDWAEQIAAQIPTLVIAADLGQGSDGLVPVECTRVPGSYMKVLNGIPHSRMRLDPQVAAVIQAFWHAAPESTEQTWIAPALSPRAERAIRALRSLPGMTDTNYRHFADARLYRDLGEGVTVRLWKSPAQVQHVFVADADGNCLFAGYVGWLQGRALAAALAALA